METDRRQGSGFDTPSNLVQVDALDAYLNDMIGAVKAACDTGTAHLGDSNPAVLDSALSSSKEILTVVMAGKVEEWIG